MAIAVTANVVNLLEGFNGLGAGITFMLGLATAIMILFSRNTTGLMLLFPFIGAVGALLVFNVYPARIFPGDTFTLFAGTILALGAIMSRVEFWFGVLMIPHVIEFVLKARSSFRAECFADEIDADGRLKRTRPGIFSLTHLFLGGRFTEPQLVARIWGFLAVYYVAVLCLYSLTL